MDSDARMMMRGVVAAVFWSAAACAMLSAQASDPTPPSCFRSRPLPRCRAFWLTNAGGYVNPIGTTNGETAFRVNVDWGLMVNTSARAAVGVSALIMLDADEFTVAPAVRYRRWFSADRSLDLAIATPISTGDLKRGSVLGMIKYNPDHWLGVALRPEYVRRDVFNCGPVTCQHRVVTSARLYTGVEVGWFPGLTLSVAGGVVLGLLIIALAGAD